jgi:glycosyltransferase involved in cell wall biosynthesis
VKPLRITVVVCTWNRCELLRQTLERLKDITRPQNAQWDVVVVNNNCSDATSDIVASFRGVLDIREIVEPQAGLSHARNRALREVTGDYIIWIDDDVLVDTNWLTAFAEAARRHPDVSAFGGPIEPWFVVAPNPDLMRAFPFLQDGFCGLNHGTEELDLRPEQPLYGANMAFAVRAIRGLRFNPALGTVEGSGICGEEIDFLDRLRARNGAVRWVPGMRVKHYVDPQRMTKTYLTKFAYDRGRAFIRLGRPTDEPRLLGAPRWVWRVLIAASLRHAVLRFTPFRTAALTSLREYHQFRGMLAEALSRRNAQVAAPPPAS